jgi:nucleotide-binding universal stress UspA family protein
MSDKTLARLVIDYFAALQNSGAGKADAAIDKRVPSSRESLLDAAAQLLKPSEASAAVRTLLIAVNDSDPSRRAVEVGCRLASQLDARVSLLHVVDISKGFSPELGLLREAALDELQRRGHDLLEQIVATLPTGLSVETKLLHGDPQEEILKASEECEADVIVIGTYGRDRVAHRLLGTTAESVVRAARVPLLTVGREPARSERPPVLQQSRHPASVSDECGHGAALTPDVDASLVL